LQLAAFAFYSVVELREKSRELGNSSVNRRVSAREITSTLCLLFR